jgi:hypothetical protein
MIIPLDLRHIHSYDPTCIILEDNFSLNGLSYDQLNPFLISCNIKLFNTTPSLYLKNIEGKFYFTEFDKTVTTENTSLITCDTEVFADLDLTLVPYIYLDKTNLTSPIKILEKISDYQISVGTTFAATTVIDPLVYYSIIKLKGSEFTSPKTNIPSNVYTLDFYANNVLPNEAVTYTMNAVYYSSLAVCIRQKLNEFVLDCNQCRNTDDVVPFFIAESAFQSLQYYEESTLDVTAINKILAALNMFCNQKTCTTC